MKLLYIANIRLPTDKAHGIQIMKTCEAIAKNGISVTLVVPKRINNIHDNPFVFYNCDRNFTIKYLPNLDLTYLGKYGVRLHSFTFSIISVTYALFNRHDLVYSRDEMPLVVSSFVYKKCIWEVHDARGNIFMAMLLRRVYALVTISNGLRDLYNDKFKGNKPILVAPDGVDIKDFNIHLSKDDCRKILGLSLESKIILYTGSLLKWKGIDTLAQSVKDLSSDTIILFVGGNTDAQREFKKLYHDERIVMISQQPPQIIPYYMKSADILVLPNSAKEKVSRAYTSPMKLFEYMASQRPIIASKLKSICEILDDNNSILIEADNSEELALNIKRIISDKYLEKKIVEKAFKDVQRYDWYNRGASIAGFLKKI